MLGNAVSGFAIGLLVLDYTGSTLLYAVFAVVYNLPKIIMPSLAGPYLDRFSRVKVIYGLDFVSAGLYLLIFGALTMGWFNYGVLLALCLVIGTVDSVYQVAYDSLYPTLISKGNFSKAYSISSMLYPLSAIMVPVAAWCYENVGVNYLFLFNSVTFLVAALFETRIHADESQIKPAAEHYGLSRYRRDFREGIDYLKADKGLLVITAYFVVSTFTSSASGTLVLPYFKAEPGLGVQAYTYVMAFAVLGRMIGGMAHYRFRYPTALKFAIALFVYIASSVIDAAYLFTPTNVMMPLMFLSGFICVTSFNIRISSTQNHVPNEMRGRFNGAFQMLTTLGGSVGTLVGGALGELWPIRTVIVGVNALCILASVLIMYRGRGHVKKIYCVEV